MMMAALPIFQALIQMGMHIGKFLFGYVLKSFMPQKVNILDACLHIFSEGLPFIF
jgi:peptidoglycan biosynthesis protein MviN/MurJ (putative lipid II flippase)